LLRRIETVIAVLEGMLGKREVRITIDAHSINIGGPSGLPIPFLIGWFEEVYPFGAKPRYELGPNASQEPYELDVMLERSVKAIFGDKEFPRALGILTHRQALKQK
jgi:hypothetical protein